MPSKKITELTNLVLADNSDMFVVVDVSTSATKNITREQLLTSDFSSTSLSSSNIDDAIIEIDMNIGDISATMLSAGVNEFNGRVGHIEPLSGDYDADEIWFDNSGTVLSGDNVQLAINEMLDRSVYVAGLKLNIVTKTETYDISANDDVIICSGSSYSVNLPIPANGKVFNIKNVGVGIVSANSDIIGGTTIDGEIYQPISQYENLQVISDNTQYWIL
jgi:hypothetical protein